jgi:Spy/CpxP family protein refolding chaperone
MRIPGSGLTAVLAVALVVGPGFGQSSLGPVPPPIILLGQKSVREELKLTEEQAQKLGAEGRKIREKFAGLGKAEPAEREKKMAELREESDKVLAEILKPEQAKRLKQIFLQHQGPRALTDAEVAKALEITDEQKKQFQAIHDEITDELKKLADAGKDGKEGEDTRKKAAELRKNAGQKMQKLLTEKQRAKWRELVGEHFKGEIHLGPARPTPEAEKK